MQKVSFSIGMVDINVQRRFSMLKRMYESGTGKKVNNGDFLKLLIDLSEQEIINTVRGSDFVKFVKSVTDETDNQEDGNETYDIDEAMI